MATSNIFDFYDMIAKTGDNIISLDKISFKPGFFEVSEATFTYEIISSGESGFGNVTSEQVPEPTSVVGLLALSVLGLGVRFKHLGECSPREI